MARIVDKLKGMKTTATQLSEGEDHFLVVEANRMTKEFYQDSGIRVRFSRSDVIRLAITHYRKTPIEKRPGFKEAMGILAGPAELAALGVDAPAGAATPTTEE